MALTSYWFHFGQIEIGKVDGEVCNSSLERGEHFRIHLKPDEHDGCPFQHRLCSKYESADNVKSVRQCCHIVRSVCSFYNVYQLVTFLFPYR
jgi:hypothetical protein